MKGEPTVKVSCWVTWLQGVDNKVQIYDLYLHVKYLLTLKYKEKKKKKC